MATQLASGLWHVDCRTLDRPNVYLVEFGGDRTLVDAGWPADAATVRTGLAAAGIDPETIDRVLVTHYDADHGWGPPPTVDGTTGRTPPPPLLPAALAARPHGRARSGR